MAQDDIYEVKFHFEAPSGYATSRFYVMETETRSTAGTDTSVLAESIEDHMGAEVLEVMADDWSFPAIEVNKVQPLDTQKARFDRVSIVGGKVGPSLPSNNAITFALSQSTFSAKHNGRIFMPPPAEVETLVSVIVNTFKNIECTNLAAALNTIIVETDTGLGRYKVGVVNQQVLNASPPIKDWFNAFAPTTSVTVKPIMSTQRKRQTRVRGAA